MKLGLRDIALVTVCCSLTPLVAQTAREVLGPAAVVPLSEPQLPARLIVDAPLPDPLSHGQVFIQYRAVYLRIVPVFDPKGVEVSPRIGHIHVSVDGSAWHWADASGEPVILVGLAPGPHKVEITLADVLYASQALPVRTFRVEGEPALG